MLKKIFIASLFLSLFLTVNSFAQENDLLKSDTFFYVGLNLGGEVATATDESTFVDENAYLAGLTLKGFHKKFGLGGTFNLAKHDDKDDSGNDESDVKTFTLDLMYNFSSDPAMTYYIAGYLGKGEEEFSGKTTGTLETDLYGVGIGLFTSNKSSFSYGGDLRYLIAPDSQNAEGIVQIYFTVGYVF